MREVFYVRPLTTLFRRPFLGDVSGVLFACSRWPTTVSVMCRAWFGGYVHPAQSSSLGGVCPGSQSGATLKSATKLLGRYTYIERGCTPISSLGKTGRCGSCLNLHLFYFHPRKEKDQISATRAVSNNVFLVTSMFIALCLLSGRL